MAISPRLRYNANQIDTSDPTNYPEGKAKNISALGNTDGSPFEKDMLNDIWGFQQAILRATQDSPTGIPESATVSQYFEALKSYMLGWRFIDLVPGYKAGGVTIPSWVTAQHRLKIHMVGGGGGGGGGAQTGISYYAGSGGGGGSGHPVEMIITGNELVALAGQAINYRVGAGGTAGAAAPRQNTSVAGDGGNGESTYFAFPSSAFFAPFPEAKGGYGGKGGYAAEGFGSTGGAGGEGWGGGGGGYVLTGTSGAGGIYRGPYDSSRPGQSGTAGISVGGSIIGRGGYGGSEFDANGLLTSRLTFFGNIQGSIGGSAESYNYQSATRYAAGGGGATNGPSILWTTNIFAEATFGGTYHGLTNGGVGPGAGGAGAGVTAGNTNAIPWPGGAGAGGMLYLEIN